MQRLHPDTPVTFRDFIDPITRDYPIKDMTEEEFLRTPFTTHIQWHQPEAWEKTGYRQPHAWMVGHDNVVFWVFVEFVRYDSYPDDFGGTEMRAKTNRYLIHVDGQPVFQRVNAYAKDKSEYVA